MLNHEIPWQQSNLQVFWGEIAPTEHLVQIYENDTVFMNTLEGFAGNGILNGDNVIIIATKDHLKTLNQKLTNHGFDIKDLIEKDKYIPLEASEVLNQFMVNGWPDEKLFTAAISGILKRAQANPGAIRAFGEMVAILWGQGNSGATVMLEDLWCRFHVENDFSLFCAYPKSGFTQDSDASIKHICKMHTRLINGHGKPSTEIYHRSI